MAKDKIINPVFVKYFNGLDRGGKTRFARKLRISRQQLYNYRDGVCSPTLRLADRIDIKTDGAVPFASWRPGKAVADIEELL